MLSAPRVTQGPPSPSAGTGMARPRWDVLAFGHCPLQEVRGRQEGGPRPPQQARGSDGSLCPARAPGSGVRMGGGRGEDERPPGAILVCPQHQAPSGHSAERTVTVTSLLLEKNNLPPLLSLFRFPVSTCPTCLSLFCRRLTSCLISSLSVSFFFCLQINEKHLWSSL